MEEQSQRWHLECSWTLKQGAKGRVWSAVRELRAVQSEKRWIPDISVEVSPVGLFQDPGSESVGDEVLQGISS